MVGRHRRHGAAKGIGRGAAVEGGEAEFGGARG